MAVAMNAAAATTLTLALLAAATLAETQCDVTVLFESHCPDSQNFIHRELVPMWHKLEQQCTLELVPFGKARSTEGGFVCQHGEKECRGNMVLSCGLQRLSVGRKQLDFTSCFMADPDYGGVECAEQSGLKWEDIENCLQSGEGTRLQKEAEQKSYNIRISRFVPTIVINKSYNQEDQNEAVKGSFDTVMCRYTGRKDICESSLNL